MTDPVTQAGEMNPAKPKEAKKPTAKKSRKIDAAKLTDLAKQISDRRGANMADLITALKADEGLKLRDTSEGRTYAKMAGIEAGARGGAREAMNNWANAARRTVMQAGS